MSHKEWVRVAEELDRRFDRLSARYYAAEAGSEDENRAFALRATAIAWQARHLQLAKSTRSTRTRKAVQS